MRGVFWWCIKREYERGEMLKRFSFLIGFLLLVLAACGPSRSHQALHMAIVNPAMAEVERRTGVVEAEIEQLRLRLAGWEEFCSSPSGD
mgnify:CR=1 FL=1